MVIGILLFGIPSAIIATCKGFATMRWIIAFGLFGLITVCCLKSAKAPGITLEESAKRTAKANAVGAWMCGINVALVAVAFITIIAAN